MKSPLSLTTIERKLRLAYRQGALASVDGAFEMYRGQDLKCAAVLIPVATRDEGLHLVFTRRTHTVEHHKGQVSFPGGRCDQAETSPEQTALREAQEEIGLQAEHVRLLGRLNDVLTITRYRVTPVVGLIPWPYPFLCEPAEVERVFSIPIQWLAQRANWDERPFSSSRQAGAFPVITYHPYDGEVLWGASARITHNFLEVIGLVEK
jgi:8-oxo-dGTP pyrophosphatase MutT (NUDIX family)